MRSLLVLLLSLTLIGCSAREDFESDLTATGVIFGLSEMGACAQVEKLGAVYTASVLAFPGRICSSYSKPTHSEYLEVVRSQLSLMVRIAEKYRTPNCEARFQALVSYRDDPLSTDALNASGNTTVVTGMFPAHRWFPLTNAPDELRNTMVETWGLPAGSVGRMGRYDEYISFMTLKNMLYNAVTPCLDELTAMQSLNHPGWHFQLTKDTIANPPVIFAGICRYGTGATAPLCTTLGPQF